MNCETCKHCRFDEDWGERKCLKKHRRVEPEEFESTITTRGGGKRNRIRKCPDYEKVK